MMNPRAFPSDADPTQPGMSLLDYLAGQSIAGIARRVSLEASATSVTDPSDAINKMAFASAFVAYEIAEAMLRERERRSQ